MRAVLPLFPLLLLVAAAGAQDRPQPVLVLGRTQLLEDANAFDAFCADHAGAKRSALRAEVVAKLHMIAAAEQPKILAALGDPQFARSLWLVNAVVVNLDARGIEAARKLASVKWVYAAGQVPPFVTATAAFGPLVESRPRVPFTTKGKTIPWNLRLLHAPEAWQAGALGEGVVVAMFDMGVNVAHEDLRGNVWINAREKPGNGVDDDENGLVDDLYGYDFARMQPDIRPPRMHHGTWTSSVVAGDGTGGTITGVAPRARIMPLIAMGGAYNAARAFQYALEQGADVVNMSFSIPDLGEARGLWRLIAEQATCAGLVLVSGAGNFPNEAVPEQIRIPEGIPCVVCAGGVTRDKTFARFTSKGPVEWQSVRFYGDHPMPKGLVKPDVCAFPGPRIGLVAPGDKGYLPENNPRRGNSLSSPHVAGVCALVLSTNPELTPWQVKAILEKTAEDLPPKGKDPETGAGLVNALAAVRAATPR